MVKEQAVGSGGGALMSVDDGGDGVLQVEAGGDGRGGCWGLGSDNGVAVGVCYRNCTFTVYKGLATITRKNGTMLITREERQSC